MDDLISRDDAIKDARSWVAADEHEKRLQNDVIEWLKQLPSEQPKPLKIDLSGYSKEDWERFRKEWANVPIMIMAQPNTGKWVSPFGIGCVCNCCGYDAGGESNFCPNCGAKMDVTE